MVLFCNLLFNLILLTATHDTTYRFISLPLFKNCFIILYCVDIRIYFYFLKNSVGGLKAGVENYSSWTKFDLLLVLVNRILLKHSHPFAYLSFMAATNNTVIVLISCGKDQVTHKVKNIYYLTLYRKNFLTLPQKSLRIRERKYVTWNFLSDCPPNSIGAL